MPRSGAVWGIDLGQCALKALRCRAHEDEGKVTADAFDYIEYPKILNQPGAEPAELIADALKQFLARNDLRGDRVAISVSGQSGLARFIKLPPVEAKKIPDIVRYEARQQIPFDLNDVIWDYQRMGGGAEEEGFALETEIGLFAMKRDAVFRTLEPFQKAGIDVDFVQLTPLAIYNYVLFDRLADLPPPEEYDPENPPESIMVVSLGTDATDLVITNGFRVWQRSIPLGGNHFTKALTKELKLTFAKAEHLKRNATSAQDPKAVFQAMRPVFNDLLTELQRSIGYFSSIERTAKLGNVLTLGNAMKLPGLRRYLSQSLGFEVEPLDEFQGLVGPEVLGAPSFQENTAAFGVAYGLALQGLGMGGLKTNLLPGEIVRERLVNRKKPWALAAAALLMLGCSISFTAYALALNDVKEEKWASAEQEAQSTARVAGDYVNGFNQAKEGFEKIKTIGDNLVDNVEGRLLWLELLKTVNDCLPPYSLEPSAGETGAAHQPEVIPKTRQERERAIARQEVLHVTNIDAQYVEDLSSWFAAVKSMNWYEPFEEEARPAAPAGGESPVGAPGAAAPVGAPGPTAATAPGPAPGAAAAGTGASPGEGQEGAAEGPSGPGWVVRVQGYHYHNLGEFGIKDVGAAYVRKTLVRKLATNKVKLPSSDPQKPAEEEMVSMKELGISHPVLVDPRKLQKHQILDPWADPTVEGEQTLEVDRFDFTVHFCWKQTTPSERQAQEEKEDEQARQGAF
jgi:type IV pilus assembly protein PilM